MVNITSVSLRRDEVEGIKVFMQNNPGFKTKHEVIKFAIRRLIFPGETSNIPLNGKVAHMERHQLTGGTHEGAPVDVIRVEKKPKGDFIEEMVHDLVKEPERKVIRKRIELPEEDEKELRELGIE